MSQKSKNKLPAKIYFTKKKLYWIFITFYCSLKFYKKIKIKIWLHSKNHCKKLKTEAKKLN
jgi:hypothetical protein